MQNGSRVTPHRPSSPEILMGGWQSGDDFPDRYCDLVSGGPYRDADSQTRRMDLPGNIQIAFYRRTLAVPREISVGREPKPSLRRRFPPMDLPQLPPRRRAMDAHSRTRLRLH